MKSEKQLYQWDVNQYLTELQPTAQFVDYPMGNEVIRIETKGKRCRIPDEFLQTAGFKTCYERYSDGTYRAYNFNVQSSPKPPAYVYTAEERTTFDALVAKADAAIEEIKRRADSGEFTPVKGVDYFTDAEKTEMMESVSSGAVGEFRKVVDTATTEYNDNHNLKLAKYNANAAEKLSTYNTNDEQQTDAYNRNAEQKLEAYNSNHTAKVAEYNANAETKTAEFDSNAAALQTEVDRLRGECDNLAAENRKQENRIDALIKLNKGQIYDILPEEGETASRTAPSGAKYVSVDKVGGKSLVWNQLCNPDTFSVVGCKATENSGIVTITETALNNRYQAGEIAVVKNHKYYQSVKIKSDGTNPAGFQNYLFLPTMNKITSAKFTQLSVMTTATDTGKSLVQLTGTEGADYQIVKNSFMLIDLTLLFGAGNEPTAEQFEEMFPAESYPYNPGEIVSSTTTDVELEGKNLWDDSNPAFTKVLTKEGFTFDGTVWKSELIDYIATPIAITKGSTFSYDIKSPEGSNARFKFAMNSGNLIYRPHESDGSWKHHSVYLPDDVHTIYIDYTQRASCEIKNIQLERSTTETAYSPHKKQSLSTGFPELHSAGTAHDVIDLDGGAIRRNVGMVDLGTLDWSYSDKYEWWTSNSMTGQIVAPVFSSLAANAICNRFEIVKQDENYTKPGVSVWTSGTISVKSDEIKSAEDFSGVTLYFEKATPTTEQVTIPEPMQEWLPVEAGGTVTFRNTDESKQLPVPNAVSWVRKLDEVE
nr:MAG TPA: hypothetical protein [Caudoviricetes sp.]